jgi:kynurenine formamidase
MKTRSLIIGYALAIALLLSGQQRQASPTLPPSGFRAVLDLTHTLSAQTPAFEPSAKPLFSAKTVATLEQDKHFARTISLPEHFGTHLDAPAHFARGLWTVDNIPPERLVAPLVVFDVSANLKNNADYLISVEDIAQWEHAHGQIPPGAVVITRTGWDSRWNSAKDFRNADNKGIKHFPGYSLDAAKFLVEARSIFGLGIDTLSIDYGPSPDFPVHQYVLAHSVYQLEGVANLNRVPASGAIVVVAPMKLEGGSGSPVRILALVR